LENTTLFNCILLGVLAGISAFALSVALAVWRRRNQGDAADRKSSFWMSHGWVAAVIGSAFMMATLVYREMPERQGVLRSKDIFTIRAEEELAVDYLTDASQVCAGDLIARFSSPKHEARIEELQLRINMLEAEGGALADNPLQLDPELIRRYEHAAADNRQLSASKDQQLPEYNRLIREKLRQRLDIEKEIRHIDTELEATAAEEQKLQARCRYLQSLCQRMQEAADRGAATATEVDEKQLELGTAKASLEQIRQRKTYLAAERERRCEDLANLTEITAAQTEALANELSKTLEELRGNTAELEKLQRLIGEDRDRARKLRRQELECNHLQAAQCRAELEGLERVLNIQAPFGGRVVFREASPKTAYKKAPLLVLARGEGLLFQCRLPANEVNALSRAEQVTFEIEDQPVQKRFTGHYMGHDKLDSEPHYVAALLAVAPPKDCIRDLTSDEKVTAELKWRPFLLTYPAFVLGLVILSLWSIMSLQHWVKSERGLQRQGQDRSSESIDRPDQAPAPAAKDTGYGSNLAALSRIPFQVDTGQGSKVSTQLGASGVVLQHLACRFRESVISESIDSHLVSAIEWAFDRHHIRAVSVFRNELAQRTDVSRALWKLLKEKGNGHKGDDTAIHEPSRHTAARAARIYHTIFPQWASDHEQAGHVDRMFVTSTADNA